MRKEDGFTLIELLIVLAIVGILIGIVTMSVGNLNQTAKERGMKYLWGSALPENTQMLALGRKLGFKITRNMAEGLIKLEIELTRI